MSVFILWGEGRVLGLGILALHRLLEPHSTHSNDKTNL